MDLVWSVPVLSGSPGVSHGLPFKNGFRQYAEDLIWDLVPMQIMASILAGQGRVWSSEGRNLHADTPSSYSQDLQHQKDTWRSWRATAAQCWTQWPTGHSSVEASSPPQVLLHCSCFLEAWMQLCHYRGGGGGSGQNSTCQGAHLKSWGGRCRIIVKLKPHTSLPSDQPPVSVARSFSPLRCLRQPCKVLIKCWKERAPVPY